ncbi:MAG: hypothetical protein AD742_04520 [Methylibium sp. NZG]|nr:MAG: hypothetical protein AD742_04520 [Methylibium sp. NZG]
MLISAAAAQAVGSTVDVQVVERDTGFTLPIHPFRGAQYVAGRPGARYAIRVSNRTGARVLAVMSVDGVNIISGQTAAWNQGGYALGPWQTHEITGWRKSPHEVAAFEFIALPDSYAARTGRPNDVGVIGVAVFGERPIVVRPGPAVSEDERRGRQDESRDEPQGRFDDQRGRHEGATGASAEKASPSAAARAATPAAAPLPGPSPEQDATARSGRRSAQEAQTRLGTGHGAREASYSSTTHFIRNSTRPLEVVSIQYDRLDNLVRAGVVAAEWPAQPRPFPRSGATGFVPDPPAW